MTAFTANFDNIDTLIDSSTNNSKSPIVVERKDLLEEIVHAIEDLEAKISKEIAPRVFLLGGDAIKNCPAPHCLWQSGYYGDVMAGVFYASVECEAGEHVVEGSHYTLAHHAERYRKNRAPCATILDAHNREQMYAAEGGMGYAPDMYVAVSHLDADTAGGLAKIWGIGDVETPVKTFLGRMVNNSFDEFVEYVDLNGIDAVKNHDDNYHRLVALNALIPFAPRTESPSHIVESTRAAIRAAAAYGVCRSHPAAVALGMELAEAEKRRLQAQIDSTVDSYEMVVETARDTAYACDINPTGIVVRNTIQMDVRVHDNVATQAYGDADVICALNTRLGNCTLAIQNSKVPVVGGKAVEIMRAVFGEGAGGQPNIAGSPRGVKCSREDLERVRRAVQQYVRERVKQG